VADLRAEAIQDGLLASLGPAGTRAFFRTAISDPDTFGFVTEDDAGVDGYVLLTSAALRIERRVLLRTPRLWLRVLISMRSRRLARRAMRLLKVLATPARSVARDPEPRLRLLDVVVAARSRGQGLGRALIEAGLAEAWERGHDSVGLSVVSWNTTARGLYLATGFVVAATYTREDGVPYDVLRATRPNACLPTVS
jgi:ribosomal protein S18 acetylase RimI-like enzyme